jgi:hypothetical protein
LKLFAIKNSTKLNARLNTGIILTDKIYAAIRVKTEKEDFILSRVRGYV